MVHPYKVIKVTQYNSFLKTHSDHKVDRSHSESSFHQNLDYCFQGLFIMLLRHQWDFGGFVNRAKYIQK